MAAQDHSQRIEEEFASHWVEVDGLPIHARVRVDLASTEAPAIVLVHGLGLSSTYLLPTAAELAADYRVYAPDLPGFGRSGKPQHTLDVPELGDALAAWMEAFGIGQAALLGNSFGCQIIVECMARHPELVKCAILQGPTTPPGERSWFWQFVRWRQNVNPKPMGKIAKQDYRACGIRRLLRTFQYSIRHRPEERLPEINMPVLVVRGSHDPICRPEWAEEIVRRLPQGRLVVIPGVQHTLVWTAPRKLARVCRPFLKTTGGDSHGEPTKNEFYDRAQVLNVEGRSSMDKDELQRAVEEAQSQQRIIELDSAKILMAAEAPLLLVPLTLVTALIVLVSYPAYPIPNPRPIQIGFDLAMLLQVAGIIAAWRLVVLYLCSGRSGLRKAHVVWIVLVAVGAMIGLLGAVVAAEHMMNPRTAEDYVGFALLAPAVVLVLICIHLFWEGRRA